MFFNGEMRVEQEAEGSKGKGSSGMKSRKRRGKQQSAPLCFPLLPSAPLCFPLLSSASLCFPLLPCPSLRFPPILSASLCFPLLLFAPLCLLPAAASLPSASLCFAQPRWNNMASVCRHHINDCTMALATSMVVSRTSSASGTHVCVCICRYWSRYG